MPAITPTALQGELWHYHNQGTRSLLHLHPELELNLVLRGTASYVVGNEVKYALARGSLVWLFPGQRHMLMEKSPDLEMWIVLFRRPLLLSHAAQTEFRPLTQWRPTGRFCRRLPEALVLELADLFTSIAKLSQKPDIFNAGLAFALLRAWNCFCESTNENSITQLHPAVGRAIEYLRGGRDEAALSVVAREARCSPAHLSQLFHRQTGMTMSRFRNRERLEAIVRRHREGKNLSLTEMALAAGFGSYVQFYRVFRKTYGGNPREWLAQKSLSAKAAKRLAPDASENSSDF